MLPQSCSNQGVLISLKWKTDFYPQVRLSPMAWYTEGALYMLSLQGHYISDYSKVQGQWVENESAGAELGRWL